MRITADVVPDTLTVVGVAAHVMQHGLSADDIPEVYVSYAQFPTTDLDLTVRTSGSPRAAAGLVRRVLDELDPTIPVSEVQALGDRLSQSVGTTRFSSVLASLFALVALVLGAVGIYSVLAYIVSQHRREIGIRIALGASHGRVMRDVLRRALALIGVGIALGLGAAWLLDARAGGIVRRCESARSRHLRGRSGGVRGGGTGCGQRASVPHDTYQSCSGVDVDLI